MKAGDGADCRLGGGNDYVGCRVCGVEWDYRKRGAKAPDCRRPRIRDDQLAKTASK